MEKIAVKALGINEAPETVKKDFLKILRASKDFNDRIEEDIQHIINKKYPDLTVHSWDIVENDWGKHEYLVYVTAEKVFTKPTNVKIIADYETVKKLEHSCEYFMDDFDMIQESDTENGGEYVYIPEQNIISHISNLKKMLK